MAYFSRRLMMLGMISMIFCTRSTFGMMSRVASMLMRPATNGMRNLVPRLRLNTNVRPDPVLLRTIMTPARLNANVFDAEHKSLSNIVPRRPSSLNAILSRTYYASPHTSIKMRLALLASRIRSKLTGPRAMTPSSSKVDFVVDEKSIAAAQQDELRHEKAICLACMQDLIRKHQFDSAHWQQIMLIIESLAQFDKAFIHKFIALFTDEICLISKQERTAYIKLLSSGTLKIIEADLVDYLENACLYYVKRCVQNPELFKSQTVALDNVASLIKELSQTRCDLSQKILKIIAFYNPEESKDICQNCFKKYGILKLDVNEQLMFLQYLREKEQREFMEKMRAYEKEIEELRSKVEDASFFALLAWIS